MSETKYHVEVARATKIYNATATPERIDTQRFQKRRRGKNSKICGRNHYESRRVFIAVKSLELVNEVCRADRTVSKVVGL